MSQSPDKSAHAQRQLDRKVAGALRRDIEAMQPPTLTIDARALRDLFSRGRLTDKARREIDDAIVASGCTIQPPLASFFEGLGTQHEIAVASSPKISFERPGRRVQGQPATLPTQPAGSPQPTFVRPNHSPPAVSPVNTVRIAGQASAEPPSRETRRGGSRGKWIGWAVAGVLGIGLIGALSSDDSSSDKTAPSAVKTEDVADTPDVAETADAAPSADETLLTDARDAAADGRYAVAYGLARQASRTDLAAKYRTTGLSRARRNAERAVASGDPTRALTIVRQARSGYDSTGALAPVAASARVALQKRKERRLAVARQKAAEKAAKKAAAREKREQAAALLAAQEAAEAESSAASESSSNGSEYAGMTCPEIGHSFPVEPGSDPDHDADNDGVACESQ